MLSQWLTAAVLPLTLLFGCGTPMVWQGPPGTDQQDLAQTRSECLHQAEAWRSYNAQVYQQTSSQTEVTGQQRAPDDLYRTADQLFDRCMIAQGYKLVPQGQ
jgi:hypothetical protein